MEILNRTSANLLPQIRLLGSWAVLKGPSFLEKLIFDVLALVKQLGIPTFLLTLSCADRRWNEHISGNEK